MKSRTPTGFSRDLALQLKAAEAALKKARAIAMRMGKDEAAARMARCLEVLAAKKTVSILRERVALDRFGRILMSRVRDEAIRHCDATTDARGAVTLVPEIVDVTLHRLSSMIGDEDMVALAVFCGRQGAPELARGERRPAWRALLGARLDREIQ